VSSERVVIYAVGRAGIGHAMRARRLAEHLVLGAPHDVEVDVVTGHLGAEHLLVQNDKVRIHVPDAIARLWAQDPADPSTKITAREAARALVEVLGVVRPSVVISTSPSGLCGEFREAMNSKHGQCRKVLALRDIYHPPRYQQTYEAVGERFDQVLVFGPDELACWTPPQVRDFVTAETSYMGYLSPLDIGTGPPADFELSPLLRCQVGGGRDGSATVEAVIQAFEEVRAGRPARLHVDVGPMYDPIAFLRLRELEVGGLEISTWSANDGNGSLPGAGISMAGYNSCAEAAWTGLPTLLVPRQDDQDLEQELRSEYFAERFETIRAHDGSSNHLRRWIDEQISAVAPHQRQPPPPAFFADPAEVAARILGEASTSGSAVAEHFGSHRPGSPVGEAHH